MNTIDEIKADRKPPTYNAAYAEASAVNAAMAAIDGMQFADEFADDEVWQAIDTAFKTGDARRIGRVMLTIRQAIAERVAYIELYGSQWWSNALFTGEIIDIGPRAMAAATAKEAA